MPETAASHNLFEYSVSEISAALKRVVEDSFGRVRVRGELSGFKVHTSGHAYFTLKDDSAAMDGVCWRGNIVRLQFKPEDGLEVVCTGKISTYPGRSKYQIVVDHMEPAGQGALMALLEKRKKQLAAEGLFDESRKKPLPFMPQVIGVITSPTGAVIRDILHRLADRFPVHVIVWPVLVQGEGAAEQVAAAIEGFNQLADGSKQFAGRDSANCQLPTANIPRPDLLIVARGGGSIEDLWAFNEEIVVRAAASSQIPLISAVGHETDTTLIDYASDRRAPTPTAAAEMAVPRRDEWLLAIGEYGQRIAACMVQQLRQKEETVEHLSRGLSGVVRLMEFTAQRLDDWGERLKPALKVFVDRKEQQLAVASAHLKPNVLKAEFQHLRERAKEMEERLLRAFSRNLAEQEKYLVSLAQMLSSLDYKQVLKRGYALVKGEQGQLVPSAVAARKETQLSVIFADGEVTVKRS